MFNGKLGLIKQNLCICIYWLLILYYLIVLHEALYFVRIREKGGERGWWRLLSNRFVMRGNLNWIISFLNTFLSYLIEWVDALITYTDDKWLIYLIRKNFNLLIKMLLKIICKYDDIRTNTWVTTNRIFLLILFSSSYHDATQNKLQFSTWRR